MTSKIGAHLSVAPQEESPRTPKHLSSAQYALLHPNSVDSILTKKAKEYIRESGSIITPLRSWSANVKSIEKGETKPVLATFTPKKNTSGIYRWKVEVLEGDQVVQKRLIGKAAVIKKRLSSYFTAIRNGQGSLASAIKRSLKQFYENKGLTISFGVLNSNVPKDLLSRVENIVIKIHKLENPQGLLNQRAGGGGASERKPLTEKDIALVYKVATSILHKKELPNAVPFKSIPFSLRMKRGVVYNIENTVTGKHYVGKTQTLFSQRLSQHRSAIKTGLHSFSLHDDLRKTPENFVVRILYQAPPQKRHILEEVERAYILALGSHKKELGYNKNKGNTLLPKMSSQAALDALQIFAKLEKK